MAPGSRFPALFVLGVAHCGSTLFGRMLDCHPRMRCFGEVLRLDRAVRLGLPCSCGAQILECDEWRDYLPLLEPERGYAAKRLKFRHFAELAHAAQVDVAVDLSKTLVWRHARSLAREGAGHVLLVRDSRGVLAATQRAGKDARSRIARHLKWMQRLSKFADGLGELALVVGYEDLCRDPRGTLKRVTDFCGLEFDEAMLRPVDQRHHLVHTSASPYLVGSNELRIDERWRGELDSELVVEIEAAMARVPLLRKRYLEDC